MSALEERRERAREAGQDHAGVTQSWALGAIEAAIETATHVKITADISGAAWTASGYGGDIPSDAYDRIIKAAFEAAGFEVEE